MKEIQLQNNSYLNKIKSKMTLKAKIRTTIVLKKDFNNREVLDHELKKETLPLSLHRKIQLKIDQEKIQIIFEMFFE